MGFTTTSTTITIEARLTPYGRQLLVSHPLGLPITNFAAGDSDSNYYATNILTPGQVPSIGGKIGVNKTDSNSTTNRISLRSELMVSANGVFRKGVEKGSQVITHELISNGVTTITGTSLTFNTINRYDYVTDSLVNLYYSFGLSLNNSQDTRYTGVTFANGGYSDTAISGLAQTKIVTIGIDTSKYGELIDGRQVNLVLTTNSGTFNIYSTFQNKGISPKVEDANYIETSQITAGFGDNIALLFSDDVVKPNGGSPTLSWATGFGLAKPFSLGKKILYNLQTEPNLALSADTPVGIVYLDKGFIVLTHPLVVSAYTSSPVSATTASTITLNSVSNAVYQNVTCILGRGEFGRSSNITFGEKDVPRISEIGLYDGLGKLVAIGKFNGQLEKNINDFKVVNLKFDI